MVAAVVVALLLKEVPLRTGEPQPQPQP
jgi:hypothetical protein